MKNSETNSKNTNSESEKGLKHLKLVGVGREYMQERLAEMQRNPQKRLARVESKRGINGRAAKNSVKNLERKPQ